MRTYIYCVVCGKKLGRWQLKYCSYHSSIMIQKNQSKYGQELTTQQAEHWYRGK